MLRIDYNIIFTIINLLVLYWLMKKFLFKRVHNILDQRQAEIGKSFEDAKKASDDANALKSQYEESMKTIQAEHDRSIDDAKSRANAEYERIISDANRRSSEIISAAKKRADAAAAEEERRAEDDIASMVKEAAGRIAASESDSSLYNDFLKEVEGQE